MRSTGIISTLFAGLLAAGCTSSSLSDLQPSSETTASVARPRMALSSVDEVLATEVQPSAGRQRSDRSPPLADIAEDDEPDVTPIALVSPKKPAFKSIKTEEAVVKSPLDGGTIHRRRFRDAKPINFGSASPKKLAVHGVDVSRWQGDIDWQRLKTQGANFAYIKSTDGGDHLDPMFRKNWNGAAKAGIARGAYHFFYWCRAASSQADWFIRNVPKVEGALPPVIDVEWNHQSSCKKRPSPATVREKMQVFMDRLEAHYGQRPVIYTAPDFYEDNLKGAFKDYPFWLRSVAAHPIKRYPNRKWVFWQYSGSGLSQGVNGHIDLNAFHGSESEWRTWLGRNAG